MASTSWGETKREKTGDDDDDDDDNGDDSDDNNAVLLGDYVEPLDEPRRKRANRLPFVPLVCPAVFVDRSDSMPATCQALGKARGQPRTEHTSTPFFPRPTRASPTTTVTASAPRWRWSCCESDCHLLSGCLDWRHCLPASQSCSRLLLPLQRGPRGSC